MKAAQLLFLSMVISFSTVVKAQWASQASGFSTAGMMAVSISAVNSNVVWASALDTAFVDVNGNYTLTNNGGTTWTPGTISGAAGFVINSISAPDPTNAWVTMVDFLNGGSAIYHTADGGTTWTKQSTTQFGAPAGYGDDIHFWNTNDGVAIGDPNPTGFEIYTTTNGGATWTAVPPANIPAELSGEYGADDAYAVVGNTIWFATGKGRVYKSIDKGQNWAVSQTGINTYIGQMAFKDANNGIVSDGSLLNSTTDGGTTWNNVNFTGNIHDIGLCFVPGTSGTYFITGADGSSYTMDNGLTWIDADSSYHTTVKFSDATTGWSGGINASATLGGMFKWVGAVGIHENDPAKFPVKIFPNPMTETAFVILPDGVKKAGFILYDVCGKMVREINNISVPSFAIHKEDLSPGIYFYKVTDSTGGKQGVAVGAGKIIIE